MAPAAIILLSDGKAMGGRDPDVVARAAGRLGVPIYTVALGTPDGVVASPFGDVIPVPPDPQSLRRMAKESGGRFFAAEDADRLSAVYENLGSRLGTRKQKREATAQFAGLGLALLLIGGALGVRWRGRLN
jgi:Ca-activated chloride channel family protein